MTKLKIICLASLALLAIVPIKIQSASAISLPADCSAYGVWDGTSSTCTLTQDLTEGVKIEENNITFNCAGHSITGSGRDYGLYLSRKSGVSVTNCVVRNFSQGIYLYLSDNNHFINNTVSNNFKGIYIHSSNDNILTDNIVNLNRHSGIVHWYSSNSVFTRNIMSDNRYNFSLFGREDDNFTNNIDTSNLIDGKPIYYLVGAENQVFDSSTNAGMFYCINCNNITVRDLTFTKNRYGIFFWKTHNSKIENVVALGNQDSGIHLDYSTHNTIINSSSLNNYSGIYLAVSNNNTIVNNSVLDNSYGIYPVSSANNTIANNDISNNEYGFHFTNYTLNDSDKNIITDNTISNNSVSGIRFQYSDDNIVTGNTFFSNKRGVFIYSAGGNKIYHNNFIANLYKVGGNAVIIFDDGYPSGGNYWDDYSGVDLYGGSNQDQPGSDGIGDTAYTFEDGRDNYPFMEENGWEILPSQPPVVSNSSQLKSDKTTPITEGTATMESIVVFKATVNDPSNNQVKLQVELRKIGESLTGIDDGEILNSDFVDSGDKAIITRYGLINGQYHWQARAVNSQGGVSEWQEFGEAGNVDFEVKTVPLYTQVRSPYPSDEETDEWDHLFYAEGNTRNYDCGSTIAGCGCAITSMVMLGRFYDIDIGIDNSNTDPGKINDWLNNNQGYSGPNLYWSKAVEYLGYVDRGTNKKMARLSFDYYNESSASSLIDDYIDNSKPIVARSDAYGHYFVIDGKLKINNVDTYTVKDPYWYNTKTLNDFKSIANHIQGYNNYFTKANLFSYLETPKKIAASMQIYLASPAELLVTDLEGRKIGRDPINNVTYNEIPNSNYTLEGAIVTSGDPLGETHEKKVVHIPDPIDGLYNIQVIGTAAGDYTLTSLVYDDKGDSKEIIQESSTVQDDIQEFELDYSTQDVQQAETYRLVDIDVKPGSEPNSINLKSKGVTPVAILSDQFFDARKVIIGSVLFAGAESLKGKFEDVDKDGDLDLMLHFETQSLNLNPVDTETVLTGELNDGTLIKGSDSVKIVGKK